MKVFGPKTKPRAVRFEAGRKSKPYRAKIVVGGKSRDLGRYATREEAEAACQAVRKIFPAKVKTAPPVSTITQEAICVELATGKSQRAVARLFGVSHEAVRQIALRAPGSAALGRDPREPVGDCW